MRIFLFAVLLTSSNSQLFSQLLDRSLNPYSQQLIGFLRSANEITDSTNDIRSFQDGIYSRTLLNGQEIKFFEIGVTSPHSRKYLAVLHNRNVVFFKSLVLIDDFPNIIMQIEHINKREFKVDQLVELLKQVNNIYRYNSNPPWIKN